MSEERDPPRLRDALLDAGRSELPDEEARLAAIAAKLDLLVGGAAGGGGAAAVATAKTGAVAKVVAGVVLASVVVVSSIVGIVGMQKLTAPAAGPPVAIVTAAGTQLAETPPPIEPLASAVIVTKPLTPHGSVATHNVPVDDPTAEVKLLERAQDALRSRPADALALCTEHERHFPHGMLAQEREVIAIEALVKGGRLPDATARADRFRAAHPSSTHQRRIDALLGR